MAFKPGHCPRMSVDEGATNLYCPVVEMYCALASKGGGASGRAPAPWGAASVCLFVAVSHRGLFAGKAKAGAMARARLDAEVNFMMATGR